MMIVQFRGRLVRQYRACVVDSLGPELRVVYRLPDLLSLLIFMPSLYSYSNLYSALPGCMTRWAHSHSPNCQQTPAIGRGADLAL